MSVKARFEEVTDGHLLHVAQNMREADAQEVWASHGQLPLAALQSSLHTAGWSVTAIIDDVPVAILGMAKATALSEVGRPWLLGTEDLFRYPRDIVVWGRRLVAMMMEECTLLENWVHCNNGKSIRWLESMGFQFDPPRPYGFYREPFMRFYLERP